MPLLPLEPYLYPEGLLANPQASEDAAAKWWVLHTRPRVEKALVRRLIRRESAFFLPLYKRQWRSRGRLQTSHLPLFPGYVFLHGDEQSRLIALQTNMIARCLEVPDQRRLYDDLSAVYKLMLSGEALAPEDRLQAGMFVEIMSGPFAGMQGKIIERKNKLRFYVEVQFLQQGVSVEIEGWMIRPLGRPDQLEAAARH